MTADKLDFKCNCCGACCKFVGIVVKQVREHRELGGTTLPFPYSLYEHFPYPIYKNGTCVMLDENNRCKVYKNRPIMCNVRIMYDIHYRYLMSTLEYLQISSNACDLLRMEVKRMEDYAAGIVDSDMQPT